MTGNYPELNAIDKVYVQAMIENGNQTISQMADAIGGNDQTLLSFADHVKAIAEFTLFELHEELPK